MSEAAPAFSFYAKDFMLGTVTMSLAERGAYITLLAYQWDHGSVPLDPAALARICGCSAGQFQAVWRVVASKFKVGAGGLLRNVRLEVERTKQAERRAILIANGRKGGRRSENQKGNQKDNQNETNRFPQDNQMVNLDETKRLSKTEANREANGKLDESLPFPSSVATPEPPSLAREESAPAARGSDPSDAPSRDLPRRYAPGGRAAHAASAHVSPPQGPENGHNPAIPREQSADDSSRTLKKSALSGHAHRAEPPEDPRVTAVFGPRR